MSGAWQHLLESIDPVAFSIGFLSVHWYGIFFLVGIMAMWLWLVRGRERGGERVSSVLVDEFFFTVLLGALAGARIGYALWYAPGYFWAHPIALISPFDPITGAYLGFSGLSFHGALIGSWIACLIWVKKRRQNMWIWADRLALVLPLGIFFGRIGNFVNGELWGRPTEVAWGMYFPLADGVLRHPSPLYEAFGEGIFLGVFLIFLRRFIITRPGQMTAWFLGLYGVIRFIVEYFREPDAQLGWFWFGLSLGQLLSLGLIGISIGIFFLLKKHDQDMI